MSALSQQGLPLSCTSSTPSPVPSELDSQVRENIMDATTRYPAASTDGTGSSLYEHARRYSLNGFGGSGLIAGRSSADSARSQPWSPTSPSPSPSPSLSPPGSLYRDDDPSRDVRSGAPSVVSPFGSEDGFEERPTRSDEAVIGRHGSSAPVTELGS